MEISLSVGGVRAVTRARSTFGIIYANAETVSHKRNRPYVHAVNMYHSLRAWSWGGDGEGPQATETPYLDHKVLPTLANPAKALARMEQFIAIRQRTVTIVGFYL